MGLCLLGTDRFQFTQEDKTVRISLLSAFSGYLRAPGGGDLRTGALFIMTQQTLPKRYVWTPWSLSEPQATQVDLLLSPALPQLTTLELPESAFAKVKYRDSYLRALPHWLVDYFLRVSLHVCFDHLLVLCHCIWTSVFLLRNRMLLCLLFFMNDNVKNIEVCFSSFCHGHSITETLECLPA